MLQPLEARCTRTYMLRTEIRVIIVIIGRPLIKIERKRKSNSNNPSCNTNNNDSNSNRKRNSNSTTLSTKNVA